MKDRIYPLTSSFILFFFFVFGFVRARESGCILSANRAELKKKEQGVVEKNKERKERERETIAEPFRMLVGAVEEK